MYLNTLDFFKAGKGSQPTRSTARNFFKRSMEKAYFFWTKTYLIWKAVGGGGTKSLNQKNLPCVVFKIPGPPCMHTEMSSTITNVNPAPTRQKCQTCRKCALINCPGSQKVLNYENGCHDCGRVDCQGQNAKHLHKTCFKGLK